MPAACRRIGAAVILPFLVALQSPAAAAVPALADDAQLSCVVLGPGDRAPASFDLDFRSKKGTNAVFAPATGLSVESPFARVSSTSAAVRRPDGSLVIGFATGVGQYRLELVPQSASVRVRLLNVVDRVTRPIVAQGFCRMRAGKPLKAKPPVAFAIDDGAVARPWQLATFPGKLPDAACRALTPDGRVSAFSYQVTAARENELWTAYRFDAADLVGATATIGSGTQFHLVAPTEHMVATTVSLGGTPTTYLHVTYERQGSFLDLSRNGDVFAVGDCGSPPPWVVAAAGVAR